MTLEMPPRIRPTARAILIGPGERVLLFCIEDDRLADRRFWICPGGGLEPGETHEQAVIREVREEAGIQDVSLGPCAWLREHSWWWPITGEWVTSIERYYVAYVAADAVDVSGQQEDERQFLSSHRWFTLDELRTSSERLVPSDFAERVAPLLRGDMPSEPITVGD